MKTRRSVLTAFVVLMAVCSVAVADTAKVYFPSTEGSWERIEPRDAGWNAEKIQEALDIAGESKSSGVVILLNGRILAEQYWEIRKGDQSLRYRGMLLGNTSEDHPIEDVASAQKSITSFLAGVAQAKGLLDFTAPVSKYLGEGWSKAPKKDETKITVRHLLSMSSGLTEKLQFQTAAGEKWMYNTTAYGRMHSVLEKAVGKDLQIITREWLTEPIGMRNSKWVDRAARRPASDSTELTNSNGFATTPRDLARFGLLVIRQGIWNDVNLLNNPQYLKTAFVPSQNMNKAYGLLWWLNGQPFRRGAEEENVLIPAAPADLFAAQGALGRKLYIVPSLDLIVTRLGDSAPQTFPNQFWTKLMQAAPSDK
jgi:CubicO group peptidase (beta-lactamase class C family)